MADNKHVGHLDYGSAKGESQINNFTGQIKVNRWGFGGSASSTVSQTGGSSGTGTPNMGPVWVIADMDSGSSELLKYMCEGDHEATVKLSVQRIGTSKNNLVQIELTEAYVTSWGVTHNAAGDLPEVQIVFTYGKIKYEYFKQQGTGNPASTGQITYDALKNELTG